MVISTTIRTVLKGLEKYFIKLERFSLRGRTYDLILLIPESSGYLEKYSWLISAEIFNNRSQREVITELLFEFNKILAKQEYASISKINVLNSNSALVKNLNFMFPYNREIIELSNITVGGVEIENGLILKSAFLEKFREGAAVTILHRKNGLMNVGVIGINQDYKIKCYTAKALREIFNPNMDVRDKVIAEQVLLKPEEFLLQNDLITFINFDDILNVE